MPKRKNRAGNQISGLYLNRGKWIYQPPMVNGNRPSAIALGTTDFTEAVTKRQEIIDRQFVKAKTRPLAQLVEEFLAAKLASGEHRAITSANSRTNLVRFERHFRVPPAQISSGDILQWRDCMLAERKKINILDGRGKMTGRTRTINEPALSRASIKSYMSSAQSFMSWLEEQQHIYRNPFRSLPKRAFPQHVPTKRDRYCTKAQRDKIISTCQFDHLRAVLMLGFHAGLRRGEILALRPHWIERDPSGRPARIFIQNEDGKDGTQKFAIKDGQPKRVPITDPLADFIQQYLRDESQPYLVWPERHGKSLRWDWKKRFKHHVTKVGMPWVSTHTMRHTFVTLLLSASPESRPSLLHIERWTGTDAATLKRHYAHLLEDSKQINAAN